MKILAQMYSELIFSNGLHGWVGGARVCAAHTYMTDWPTGKREKFAVGLLKTPGADHIKKLSRGPQPATLRRPQLCVPFASAQTHTKV
jgi:hypothetical protein